MAYLNKIKKKLKILILLYLNLVIYKAKTFLNLDIQVRRRGLV